MTEVTSHTLRPSARELTGQLTEARAALEAFCVQQDNISLLRKCDEYLHSAHDALCLVEVYGAALLAEEMHQVTRYLLENFSEKRHLNEGLDALMRAMVQLPSYLERVANGGRDMALVLLPLMNDLRAVRGHALLSEGTLLLLNLSSDQQINPQPQSPVEGEMTVPQWALRLLGVFRVALFCWIEDEGDDQSLEILGVTARKIEQLAVTQTVFQLWWVVGAVVEALREGGLEGNASVKLLLGQTDGELKRLYEEGEDRYADSPPTQLLNNFLYHVHRAKSSGPKVTAVRNSFRLSELLPVDDNIEQAPESLTVPATRLIETVTSAIREDLSRVKNALDVFVRQGSKQVEELNPQVEMLRKIGETLGLLGFRDLSDKVQVETGDLKAIVSQRLTVSESTLLRMAATLTRIEDSLDEQLVGFIVPTEDGSNEPQSTVEDLGRLGWESINERLERPEVQEIEVNVWLSGHLGAALELELAEAIEQLLIDSDLVLKSVQQPIRGSYFQVFKYIDYLTRRGGQRLLGNLQTLFGTAVDQQQTESVVKLAKILSQQDDVVIRISNMLAVKVTSDRIKPITVITIIEPELQHLLTLDPHLIRRPHDLIKIISTIQDSQKSVTASHDGKISSGSARKKRTNSSSKKSPPHTSSRRPNSP